MALPDTWNLGYLLNNCNIQYAAFGYSVKANDVFDSIDYTQISRHLAKSPRALRRFLLYRRGVFILTCLCSIATPLLHEVRHELTEFQQIAKAAQCASATRRHLRIRVCRIGPLRRNGENSAIGKAKQPELARSVAAPCNAYPNLSGIRMEGVGHGNKVRRGRRHTCISD
jgi:hypothetical protein